MFSSRIDAGNQLADQLKKERVSADLVLGIPRGGVVVAEVVAKALQIPLDVLVVKKLGAPHNPELAIGAITSDDVTYIDQNLAQSVGADKAFVSREVQTKHHEFETREKLLRSSRPVLKVKNKSVIVIDDGVATGATVLVAIEWLRKKAAKRIILALPVVASETARKLKGLVDTSVILEEPVLFGAVGEFYKDFREVTDEEVVSILRAQKIND